MDQGMGMPTSPDGQNMYRPDDVIAPTAFTPVMAQQGPAATDAQITPAMTPETPVQKTAQPETSVNQQSLPQYAPANMRGSDHDVISWSASEFVGHQKPAGWYAMLIGSALVIAALVWLLTRDLFPSVSVLAGVIILGVYAARKPHEEVYALDRQGVTIGTRHYGYHEFKSFTVMPEGSRLSVELTPLKRFAMYASLYLGPEDEERVLDRLSEYLPMEEGRVSVTDSVLRRIHF